MTRHPPSPNCCNRGARRDVHWTQPMLRYTHYWISCLSIINWCQCLDNNISFQINVYNLSIVLVWCRPSPSSGMWRGAATQPTKWNRNCNPRHGWKQIPFKIWGGFIILRSQWVCGVAGVGWKEGVKLLNVGHFRGRIGTERMEDTLQSPMIFAFVHFMSRGFNGNSHVKMLNMQFISFLTETTNTTSSSPHKSCLASNDLYVGCTHIRSINGLE